MKGNVPWVIVLRSCAERHNVDIDHKDCEAIAGELVLRGKLIKEKDAALSGMKAINEKLSQEIAELSEELYAKNLQRRLDYKGIFDEGYEKGYMDTWDKVTKEILNYKTEIAELKAEIMRLRYDPARKSKETDCKGGNER